MGKLELLFLHNGDLETLVQRRNPHSHVTKLPGVLFTFSRNPSYTPGCGTKTEQSAHLMNKHFQGPSYGLVGVLGQKYRDTRHGSPSFNKLEGQRHVSAVQGQTCRPVDQSTELPSFVVGEAWSSRLMIKRQVHALPTEPMTGDFLPKTPVGAPL